MNQENVPTVSEDLRRSKRISQRSGEKGSYEGKYAENNIELLEIACSAKCLSNSRRDLFSSKEHIDTPAKTPQQRQLLLSAFRSPRSPKVATLGTKTPSASQENRAVKDNSTVTKKSVKKKTIAIKARQALKCRKP